MENELKTQAARLSQEEQYQIRKNIIRLSKKNKTYEEIPEIFDVSLRHVQSAKKQYADGDITAIKAKRRGRRFGAKRTLTLEQEIEIQSILVDKTPDQLKFKECMWNRKRIAGLIRWKHGIPMPESTLGVYLARWGFSVQRPTKRAYKQNEEQRKNWTEAEFPGLCQRAKAEDAETYFGDETGLQNQPTCLRKYAPEYNPDELPNSDLKRGISKRPSPRSDNESVHNVRSHLKKVQLRPDKINGFFASKSTCYAAYLRMVSSAEQ